MDVATLVEDQTRYYSHLVRCMLTLPPCFRTFMVALVYWMRVEEDEEKPVETEEPAVPEPGK